MIHSKKYQYPSDELCLEYRLLTACWWWTASNLSRSIRAIHKSWEEWKQKQPNRKIPKRKKKQSKARKEFLKTNKNHIRCANCRDLVELFPNLLERFRFCFTDIDERAEEALFRYYRKIKVSIYLFLVKLFLACPTSKGTIKTN